MVSSNKKVFFSNYVFEISENVYEPSEDSFLFAENLEVKQGDVVLDMGTGCGILGIVASETGALVVAVDINPYAVHCAKENAKLNHVLDKFLFIQCDLFSAVRSEKKFDVILFNAPYLPSETSENGSWLEKAWSGGISGRQVLDRFIDQAPKYLADNGHIFLMQSSLSGLNETLLKLEDNGLKVDAVAKRDLPFFETIVLLKAKR